MKDFLSIPGWDGAHPAVVQFPLALLIAAAALFLISLFARNTWRTWAGAALVVMALGALAAWIAVGSGHAAGQLVDKTPALERAIARHENLGVLARNLFTVLTLILAALLLVESRLRQPLPAGARNGIHVLFLLVFLGGAVLLAGAASQGGRLVHESGIQAMTGAPVANVSGTSAATSAAAPAPDHQEEKQR
jgi:uncharacterized membrane protein